MITIDIAAELEPIIRRVVREELAEAQKVDTTPLSDEQVAQRLHRSVATIRRMKKDGRLNSIPTARGRVVRVCDLVF